MKSPFAIFRKNQKVAMVVLGILVMFAFVIGPALQDLSGSELPPSFRAILFAIFGAVILGGIGYSSGRAKEFALTGFVLGAVIGVVLPRYFGPALAVESTAGNLTEQELRQLIDRKRIANQFLIAAYDATLSDIERQLFSNPQFARFFAQQRQQRLAPFYFQDANESSVLQTFLMNHEAEQMEITVSNETINKYIRALTQQPDGNDSTKTNSLTPTQFHEILKRMGLSEKELFDALREEIKARMAMELIAPPNLTTPDQYWQSYQKLNVKQELDAVALDVEAFMADIDDPSEGVLIAFFSQHRETLPNLSGPGVPGFLQRRRVTLEYLEVDYASAEEEILQSIEKERLTSEERETKLENERLRIAEAVAEVETQIQDGTIKKENEDEEKDLAGQSEILKLLEDGQEINKLDFEIAKYYEDNKNFRYRNRFIPDDILDRNNPFDDSSFFLESETSSEKNQPEETQNDSESDDKQQPSSQKPEDDPQKKDSSPDKQPQSDNSDSSSSGSKNTSEPKKENSDPGSALLETQVRLFQVAFFLDDDDQPDAKSDPQQDTDPNDSSKSGDAKKKSGDAKKKSGDEKKTSSATSETMKIIPARRGPDPPPLPEEPPLPRYRPLDAELKNEIRDELIGQKTTELVNDRVADAINFMRKLEVQYQDDLDRLRESSGENNIEDLDEKQVDRLRSKVALRLNDYATEKSLVYGATESLSKDEFSELENKERYPITSAGIPDSNSFSRMAIIERVFSRNSDEYSVSQAEADNFNRFVYWKTEDIDSFIPESLAEPGIRKQVLHAWKMGKAREEVLKRAEELKEIVRKSETEMSESLNEETLTGKKGDMKLTVQPTESFSWLETGLPDPSDPFGQSQTAQIWDIITIEKAGIDFMRKVFEELQEGDVGVTHNFDKSIYYVVKVKKRSTSVTGSMDALEQGFRSEWFRDNNPIINNMIYYSLNQQSNQPTVLKWRDRFYDEKYELKRNRTEANR